MYDLKIYKNERYTVGGRTVVWFFDEEERSAGKLLPDNLFVTDGSGRVLWSLRKAVGREDVCVLVRVEGETVFFSTFNGFSARLNIATLELSGAAAHK